MRSTLQVGVLIAALCSAFAILPTQRAEAVSNVCPIGPCNFSDATIVNVYIDTSASQWDTDLGGPAASMTQAQIDAFTLSLAHSTYFSQLKQYGVNSVIVAPSITTGTCGSVPANVDAAINNIDAIILCALTHSQVTSSNQVIINVFLPPQVINTGFCNPNSMGAHNAAMHGSSSTFASPLYTVIPTTSACLGSAGAVFSALTHEMVEALTDPDPGAISGWKNFADGEIADQCENLSTFPTSNYTIGNAQQYWSNSAGKCVTGFAPATAPTIASGSICGSGKDMQFTLNGTFGPAPWDLASNAFAGESLYVRATIANISLVGGTLGTWTAGLMLGSPPTADFRTVSWTPHGGPNGMDQIKISGFGAGYGSPGVKIAPGDKANLSVENVADGSRATLLLTVPAIGQVSASAAPDITAGQTGNVTFLAKDNSGCSLENATLSVASSAGTFPSSLTTSTDGRVEQSFTYPDVAGPVSFSVTAPVSASVTTRVHPRLDSLSPVRGSAAGGQLVVLTGIGFDNSTAVNFGANAATVQSVSSDHKTVRVLTPPSTLAGSAGPVTVTTNVHTVAGGLLQYDYINANVPVFEFLGAPGSTDTSHSCAIGQIRVSVFDAAGTLQSTSIRLSASYAAIQSTGKTFVNSRLVASGSVVTISGGGPITAVTIPNSASATASFPVWPQDLCDGIKMINGKVSHMVATKAQILQSMVTRVDPETQTTIWGDAENVSVARNRVTMQARDGEALAKTYEVVAIGEDAQRALIARSPLVAVISKSSGGVTFVGPMLEIRAANSRDAKTVRLPKSTRLSFAVSAPGPVGSYAVVRLRALGNGFAWVEEHPATFERDGIVVTATATVPGTYALVAIERQAKRAQ